VKSVVLQIFAVACVGTALVPQGNCADNAALMEYARANVDRFRTEPLKTRGITYGTKVTISVLDKDISTFWEYNLNRGVLAHKGFGLVGQKPQLIPDHCVERGTYQGQNAFGAKFTVTRKDCEQYLIGANMDTLYQIWLVDSPEAPEVAMSTAIYRKIQKEGVRTEADFIVGNPAEQELVGYIDKTYTPTIDDPNEVHGRIWIVYAVLKQIRWFIPGEQSPTVIWTAAQ